MIKKKSAGEVISHSDTCFEEHEAGSRDRVFQKGLFEERMT